MREKEAELKTTTRPTDKHGVLLEIQGIRTDVRAAEDALDDCIAAADPVPPPLAAQLNGSQTFTVTHPVIGSVTASGALAMDLIFSPYREFVSISAYADFVGPPIGFTLVGVPFTVVTTVSMNGPSGGLYNAGNMLCNLDLKFDHDNILAGDSTVRLTLTTDPPGTPFDATGSVRLVGSGLLHGGTLDSGNVAYDASGIVVPHP